MSHAIESGADEKFCNTHRTVAPKLNIGKRFHAGELIGELVKLRGVSTSLTLNDENVILGQKNLTFPEEQFKRTRPEVGIQSNLADTYWGTESPRGTNDKPAGKTNYIKRNIFLAGKGGVGRPHHPPGET